MGSRLGQQQSGYLSPDRFPNTERRPQAFPQRAENVVHLYAFAVWRLSRARELHFLFWYSSKYH
jgi:hypothetical protein